MKKVNSLNRKKFEETHQINGDEAKRGCAAVIKYVEGSSKLHLFAQATPERTALSLPFAELLVKVQKKFTRKQSAPSYYSYNDQVETFGGSGSCHVVAPTCAYLLNAVHGKHVAEVKTYGAYHSVVYLPGSNVYIDPTWRQYVPQRFVRLLPMVRIIPREYSPSKGLSAYKKLCQKTRVTQRLPRR